MKVTAGSTALVALLASPSAAQTYVVNAADIPQGAPFNDSYSENVDFGDVDLDGDWDAVFADGGDSGNDQNRLWINLGGLQSGTVGTFADQTGTRMPALSDDSRDIEFVDFDNDGDLDLYTSNTATVTNQGNRWAVNLGGAQAGSSGFYADETASRWVGLNSASSSVPDSLLLPDEFAPETFIDWSCDCDFGDLDNDGDLDLVHSTYGGNFDGGVPTRVYMNDGDGHFEEFNPSGFKLGGSQIQPGDPGLWCEGAQEDDTTMSDGSRCDIATTALDIDLGDMDGDLDLDILHGARNEPPRIYHNRLSETGSTGFRDVSGSVFPDPYSVGVGHYEQEMADLDGDGDLDLYGLNWIGAATLFGPFHDASFENDGTGTFLDGVTLANSAVDDAEGDFVDFDNDGDLDLFVGSFGSQNRLYENTHDGGVGFSLVDVTATELPSVPLQIALDIDVSDVDNDGDYDVFESCDAGQPNRFFENASQVPDTTPPYVPLVEGVSGHAATATGDVVRAQVYDNAGYYITWFNDTSLVVNVDGIDLGSIAMSASGGQLFRGVLPGNLVGEVTYSVVSSDKYGNTGSSAPQQYTNTGSTGTLQGSTSDGSQGPPTVRSLTAPVSGAPLHLVAGNAGSGAPGVFLFSLANIPGGVNLGDGLVLNVNFPLVVNPVLGSADGDGNMTLSVLEVPQALSGFTLHTQAFFADGAGGNTWAATQSLALPFP